MKSVDKRGLSPVIAVVLLVLVTIVAVSIIVAFVIPFVNTGLEEGKSCFDVLGDLSLANTQYNCYVDERAGFSVRINNEKIKGFSVSLVSQGSSKVIDIENGVDGGALSPRIRMLGVNFGNLSVPERGGIRTYVAEGNFSKIEIFPILEDGGKCDLADEINLKVCDAATASEISEF